MAEKDTPHPEETRGPRILVIEDDTSYGVLLRYQLEREGYDPTVAGSGEEGLKRVEEFEPAVVLLDVMLPGKDGRAVLEDIHNLRPEMPVVMMTAVGTVEMAVECMKRGAYDFLTKPFEFERLYAILRNATQFHDLKVRVQVLEGALAKRHAFDQIVAHAPAMRRVVEQSSRAAASDSDVLILGESGTGKEVLARAIHFNSSRRKGPFVAINCGAIPEGLLESELFGHEKGAFTGAVARRTGCFEQANGGTLFLDEIAEMRPDMQVRLLRALEEREVRRVGSDRTLKVNVRVISATNQDIRARLADHRFRTDLYYRLAILVLEIPPLRERPEDIGPLAQHFLHEANRDGHTRATVIAPEAVEVLLHYDWPGNVRELRNAIERAIVFEDKGIITVADLPADILRRTVGEKAVPPPKLTETYSAATFKALLGGGAPGAAAGGAGVRARPPTGEDARGSPAAAPAELVALPEAPREAGKTTPAAPTAEILTMDEEEKRVILRALSLTGGNVSEAARRLGLHRSTLHRKMARFGLATDDDTSAEDLAGEDEAPPAK